MPEPIPIRSFSDEEMVASIITYASDHAEEIYAANKVFYDSPMSWRTTTWKGVHAFKAPTDLWAYQELLFNRRPDLIIETGTAFGGTALFLADMMDLFNIEGRIITVDIADYDLPVHPRITALRGSSLDPDIVAQIKAAAVDMKTVMVILDSDHNAAHVAKELAVYAPLVTLDSFLIVEDTNMGEGGPWTAVLPWLAVNGGQFVPQPVLERFLITFNPNGYLWKIKE